MKKYSNFAKHLLVLEKAREKDLTDEFIISGIVDKFLIQFELSWKVLKELLRYEGSQVAETGSPRTIIKEAFSYYDFLNEEIWLEMLKARNDMSHIYNEEKATFLVQTIIERYIPEFQVMNQELLKRYGETLQDEL